MKVTRGHEKSPSDFISKAFSLVARARITRSIGLVNMNGEEGIPYNTKLIYWKYQGVY